MPFHQIWEQSAVFHDLRDLRTYKGKCGRCEFLKVCGGCRARAYEITGDYLAEEPYCVYVPKK
jgi:radical SAM protein with 4Fe4S-binding SPASM domain